jgi:hypothetical protein
MVHARASGQHRQPGSPAVDVLEDRLIGELTSGAAGRVEPLDELADQRPRDRAETS